MFHLCHPPSVFEVMSIVAMQRSYHVSREKSARGFKKGANNNFLLKQCVSLIENANWSLKIWNISFWTRSQNRYLHLWVNKCFLLVNLVFLRGIRRSLLKSDMKARVAAKKPLLQKANIRKR